MKRKEKISSHGIFGSIWSSRQMRLKIYFLSRLANRSAVGYLFAAAVTDTHEPEHLVRFSLACIIMRARAGERNFSGA